MMAAQHCAWHNRLTVISAIASSIAKTSTVAQSTIAAGQTISAVASTIAQSATVTAIGAEASAVASVATIVLSRSHSDQDEEGEHDEGFHFVEDCVGLASQC